MECLPRIMPLHINQSMIGIMQRLQSFKYELMPNGEQQHNMRRLVGSCRFVFNRALALLQTLYAKSDGLCYPQGYKLKQANGRVILTEAWLDTLSQQLRSIDGSEKHTMLCKQSRWFASVQTEREIEQS